MAREDVFVSTEWLAERLDAPDIIVVDGSWYLPAHGRDPHAEFAQRRIPGAVHFDIDTVKDAGSDLPHMLPRPEPFAAAVGAMGIGDGMRIVVYDGLGLFSAPRVRWTFRTFGAKDVVILEGVGACAQPLRELATLTVFLDADAHQAIERAIARDGESLRPQLMKWLEDQTRHFARDNTRTSCDVVIS